MTLAPIKEGDQAAPTSEINYPTRASLTSRSALEGTSEDLSKVPGEELVVRLDRKVKVQGLSVRPTRKPPLRSRKSEEVNLLRSAERSTSGGSPQDPPRTTRE